MSANPNGRPAPGAALAEAAEMAGAAPSIHNTQPWHWHVAPDGLHLRADRARQLHAVDPDGRMMIVSCGAALHHARVALAAHGWQAEIHRLPDAADPDLLARIDLDGRAPVTTGVQAYFASIRRRHTDRRPVAERPVPAEALTSIVAAATGEGARLQILRPEQVDDLASASAKAAEVNATDPAVRSELAEWTGGVRGDGAGIPDTVIPAETPQTNVPGREFAGAGTLRISHDHDREAVYALLYGDTDDPVGWLAGGEALSALWLTAVGFGLGVMPISEAVEMPGSRQILRRTLSFLGWPYLGLRIGYPDPHLPGPAGTPRLAAEQTVD
ncbi:MAG: nitroreductase [Hamadaea sp.]|nr:nitroreductase [Hamadaea sp.]